MPFLDDLVTQLQAEGVGTFGADIFASTMSRPPHLASGFATIVLTDTAGTDPERTHNETTRPAFRNPGAQLVARADTYVNAMAKAEAAYAALFKVRNQFINSGWYRWVKPQQEPFDLGVDDRGQSRVGFNVLASYSR